MSSTKPTLRGVSHEWACYASALLGPWLVWQARTPEAMWGAAVFSFCLFFLYAASALYHRPHWEPPARAWMRRIDHSAIFLLIAGTGTPVALLTLEPSAQKAMLLTMWAAAIAGVLKSWFWLHSPKWLTAVLCIIAGGSSVPFLPELARGLGTSLLAILFLGSGCILLGALAYIFKKPNPKPGVFGYHEVFHAFVVAGTGCYFWMILSLVRKNWPTSVDMLINGVS